MTARTLPQLTLVTGPNQLSTTPAPFNQIVIYNPNSSDTIYFGDKTVTSTNGIPILASASFNSGPCGVGQGDASQIYVTGTAGDKVNVFLL